MDTQRVDYRTYINGHEWAAKRTDALHRSKRRGVSAQCEVCGTNGYGHKNSRDGAGRLRVPGSNGLEVHHLHYRNLGNENRDDLIVLCTSYARIYWVTESWYRIAPMHRPPMPRLEDYEGCHERVHRDPVFRREVDRLAAMRIA